MLEFNPATDFKLLLAVPLIPLFGYAIQICIGRKLPRKGDWLLTSGMFVAMCITLYMGAKALAHAYGGAHGEAATPFAHSSLEHGLGFKWLDWGAASSAGAADFTAGIYFDGLGAAMLAVVGVVSFFVHLFSIGYMHGDRRYHIFFANISLFTFAMLGLVLADNLLFLFMFWEIMGLMSYLLIGHFSHDPTSARIRFAAAASKKAFLTTRVGDVCLFVGLMMFLYHFGTLRFTELWAAGQAAVAANGGEYPAWMTTAGLLVFGGTMGKSAQFPLHIWLPDAMEGPTPVSAMIHAATMVAAGVFLLGRTYPLLSPEVLQVAAVVGATTALFAATIGTTVNDIKGVLAYSTISQLGFMVAAVGVGGVVAGMFHMVTHAFFKACLFLCAGSVIHGCHHEQDMRRMGGLRRMMPITFAAMLVSTLAIAGIPLFSGFYSKDKIIMAAFESNMAHFSGVATFVSIALPAAALLTAFYMFRLIFMTFFGTYRGGDAHATAGAQGAHAAHGDHGEPAAHAAHDPHAAHGSHAAHTALAHASHVHAHAHDAHGQPHGDTHGAAQHGGHAHVPHESPWPMTTALICLGLLGLFGGHFWLLGDPLGHHGTWFERLITLDTLYLGHAQPQQVDEHVAHSAHSLALAVSLAVALGGIALAAVLYLWRRGGPARFAAGLGPIYALVRDKYYVDEFVHATLIRGSMLLSAVLKIFDERIVDGFVLLVGRLNRTLGNAWAWFDKTIVDGLVNFVGLASQALGAVARLVQTGRIQQYAAFAVAGGLLAAAWLILA
jgi:NADH-quinone oxidoreductase subunit L